MSALPGSIASGSACQSATMGRGWCRLLWLEPELLDQVAKLQVIALHECAKVLRTLDPHLQAADFERLAVFGIGRHLGKVRMQLLNDGGRRTSRHQCREPKNGVHARQALFGEGRHVRQAFSAARRRGRQRAQIAALYVRDRRRGAVHEHGNVARHEAGDRLGGKIRDRAHG